MSYRPQFPTVVPEELEEFEFTHYFDPNNAPGLGATLQAGQELIGIPLPLEADVEYTIRAVEVFTDHENPMGIRFRDGYGNYLSDDYVPVAAYSGAQDAPVGACPVPIEPELRCPPGALILVDLKNLS